MNQDYNLIIKEEAKFDIEDAYEWYESKQMMLGDRFKSKLRKAFQSILQNPNGCQVFHGNHRQASIPKFPYVIVFEIFDLEIVVYAVFHTSQNPKKKIR